MAFQRFLPSDFGVEEDRITPLPPFEAFLEKKRKIRRIIEAAGIPYTFVSANCFGSYFLNYLLHPHQKGDDIAVYGSGEAKGMSITISFTLISPNIFLTIHKIHCSVVMFSGAKLRRRYCNVHNQSG
jgi:hypothetical protein